MTPERAVKIKQQNEEEIKYFIDFRMVRSIHFFIRTYFGRLLEYDRFGYFKKGAANGLNTNA
jgi:hypothetical protein